MGTSSVRNLIDIRWSATSTTSSRRATLGDCVTTLDARLDPAGDYADFGFIAAPRDVIDDVTNMDARRRDALIDAINELDAQYVVLDLKSVSMPRSSTSCLFRTADSDLHAAPDRCHAGPPARWSSHALPQAAPLFAKGSEVYASLPGLAPSSVNALIDRAEDAYHPQPINLDGFIDVLRQTLGDHPVLRLVPMRFTSSACTLCSTCSAAWRSLRDGCPPIHENY